MAINYIPANVPIVSGPSVDFSALQNASTLFDQSRLTSAKLRDLQQQRAIEQEQRAALQAFDPQADRASQLQALVQSGNLSPAQYYGIQAQQAQQEQAAQQAALQQQQLVEARRARMQYGVDVMGLPREQVLTMERGGMLEQAIEEHISQPEMTAAARDYQMAQQQGYQGSFIDYQTELRKAGATNVNVGAAGKPPQGYQWVNPNNPSEGLTAIPGGPAEKVGSEVAGRIGLAEDALTQLDKVEKAAREGKMTGPWDFATSSVMGRGEGGRYVRELKAGAEALTRMLTGAGMNEAEAAREAELYTPRPIDNAQSLADKVSQLKRRLKAVIEINKRGRDRTAPQTQGPDGQLQNIPQRRMRFNPDTGQLEDVSQ